MRDMLNSIAPKRGISPVSVGDNTVQSSQIIDRQGFESLVFLIATGSLADADATFTVSLLEGDDSGLSDGAAPSANDLIGTTALASFLFSDDDKCFKIGYKGAKRYVQLKITPANNSSAALLCVIALLGNPMAAPTPNPPA